MRGKRVNTSNEYTAVTPDGHVVWCFGTGNVGVGHRELNGPHSAEENPFDPDEIVVSEQYGCDGVSGQDQCVYLHAAVTGTTRLLAVMPLLYKPVEENSP